MMENFFCTIQSTMFIDCVQDDDDEVAYRQIPFEKKNFSSLWVSESGTVKRRYLNVFTNKWTWGKLLPSYLNNNGEIFVNTGTGQLRVKDAIMSAWKQSMDEDSSSDSCDLDEKDETWIQMNDDISVSSMGKFKNGKGEVYEGTIFKSKNMICLPEIGAVDVDKTIDYHFSHIVQDIKLPKRLSSLHDFLKKKKNLQEYATNHNLKLTTVYSYVYELFQYITLSECQIIADKLISDIAKEAMFKVFHEGKENIFSQPANLYMKNIDEMLHDNEEWKNTQMKFEEIRILKSLCQKMCEFDN